MERSKPVGICIDDGKRQVVNVITWEQRKLGEVVEKVTTKNNDTQYIETFTNSAELGIMSQREYFDHDVSNIENISGYYIVENDAFVYNPRISTSAPVGPINRNKLGRTGVMSPLYTVFKVNGIDSEYLEWYFKSTGWHSFMKFNGDSGARSDRFSIKDSVFFEMPIPTPDIDEQEKIGEYFSSLDHLITLHQRKCDEMKKMKKFMLQKMFPKNGQKNPEIRFDGFTDDWEQRKFSDYYKMSSGYAFKMSDYCEDGIGLINGESIQHGIINDDNLNHLPESFIEQYPDFILKEGDIVVGLNRPITNGNLKIARIPSKYNDSLLYQRAGKVVYKEECDRDFSYVLLSQEILKHTLVEAVGSDQPFISTSKLDKWQMMIPKDIEEQHKIGEYFSNLDNLITLHQRKCNWLKKLKEYMLKNIFQRYK